MSKELLLQDTNTVCDTEKGLVIMLKKAYKKNYKYLNCSQKKYNVIKELKKRNINLSKNSKTSKSNKRKKRKSSSKKRKKRSVKRKKK